MVSGTQKRLIAFVIGMGLISAQPSWARDKQVQSEMDAEISGMISDHNKEVRRTRDVRRREALKKRRVLLEKRRRQEQIAARKRALEERRKKVTTVDYTAEAQDIPVEPVASAQPLSDREYVARLERKYAQPKPVVDDSAFVPAGAVAAAPPAQAIFQREEALGSTPRRPWGFGVYAFYSSADKIKTSNNSADAIDTGDGRPLAYSTGEFATTAGFGIGLEHSLQNLITAGPVGFGYSVGATYEFGRKIDRSFISSGGFKYSEGTDPSLSLILPYVNVVASYNVAYFFGGINYSVPMVQNAQDESFAGNIGFQLGLGAKVTDWISVELVQRFVRMSVDPDDSDTFFPSQFDLAFQRGLGVAEEENLQLNGLNLNIKLTF